MSNGNIIKYLEIWAFQNTIDAQSHFKPLVAAIMTTQPLCIDMLGDGEAQLQLQIIDTSCEHMDFILDTTMAM